VDDHRRGRVESRAYQRRVYDGMTAKNVSAESVRWEGHEERISGERTMGRQRRTYQRRAHDGKAAKGAVDDHRRGKAESRAYQRRAYVRWEGSEERISGERTIRTRPSTVSPRNFVFLLCFLTGGPDISQRPSTEGPSPEGITDGSALIPRSSSR
jgi:hypothetical protein